MGYFCEADNAPQRSMLVSEPLALAARRIYRAAGITNPRRQFDVVEVQEPYTCFELSYYESLGLCAPGEAAELIASGATQMRATSRSTRRAAASAPTRSEPLG